MLRNNLSNFDPAFWKIESAQAKIVVHHPRNEYNLVRKSLFTYSLNKNTTEFGVLWVLNTHTTDCAAKCPGLLLLD
jgi:hypothetical protein